MIKVFYERSWFGYTILYKGANPESNSYVPASSLDEFKQEMKRRFKTDDIEFVHGLENYYK